MYAKTDKAAMDVGHVYVAMRMSMFCAFEKNSSIIWNRIPSIMQIYV
jgi:hypothetical protein